MTRDPYIEFANSYDQFHGEFGVYDDLEVAFYKKLFLDHNITSVLDCACGTGQHLPLFDSLGCEVVGSDVSAAMLKQAQINLERIGKKIDVLEIDYRNLSSYFNTKFDAVVCLTSSILHMPNESEFVRAIKSMGTVLKPGGLLILTQGTTDKQWKEKPRFILGANNEKLSRVFVIDYNGEGATYNIIDINHSKEQNELQTWSVEYNKIYLKDDHDELLKESGFSDNQFFGDYDFTTYDKRKSRRLISIAKK